MWYKKVRERRRQDAQGPYLRRTRTSCLSSNQFGVWVRGWTMTIETDLGPRWGIDLLQICTLQLSDLEAIGGSQGVLTAARNQREKIRNRACSLLFTDQWKACEMFETSYFLSSDSSDVGRSSSVVQGDEGRQFTTQRLSVPQAGRTPSPRLNRDYLN